MDPRACTSKPSCASFPNATGAKPSCSTNRDTWPTALSSSLDKNMTRRPRLRSAASVCAGKCRKPSPIAFVHAGAAIVQIRGGHLPSSPPVSIASFSCSSWTAGGTLAPILGSRATIRESPLLDSGCASMHHLINAFLWRETVEHPVNVAAARLPSKAK